MTMTEDRPRARRKREPQYTTAEVLTACPGLSFRMLDWWLRTGTVTIAAGGAPGSGRSRMWTQAELNAVLAVFDRYKAAKAEIASIRSGEAWAEAMGVAEQAS